MMQEAMLQIGTLRVVGLRRANHDALISNRHTSGVMDELNNKQ